MCYFSLAMGLHRRMQAFSSCDEWGYSLVGMPGLFIMVTSLVAEP